jgi:hypothetical protein
MPGRAAFGRDMTDPLLTASVLLLLEGLFVLRVGGQLLVVHRSPRWLPQAEQWASGLLPYPLLLGIQVVVIGLMTAMALGIALGWPALAAPRPGLGSLVVVLAVTYAVAMLARFVLRAATPPQRRRPAGTIPIVFHLVLATWLLVLGAHWRA